MNPYSVGARRTRTLPCLSLLTALSLGLFACADPEPPRPTMPDPLAALHSQDAAAVAHAFVVVSERLEQGTEGRDRAAVTASLEQAVSQNPAGVNSFLEIEHAGAAVRRYAEAMLETGRGEQLGRQLAAILRGGDAKVSPRDSLGRGDDHDGAVRFPRAQEAGFFAGAVAWALDRTSDPAGAAARVAAGLGCPAGRASDSWGEWLRAASLRGCGGGDAVPGGAAHQFDLAFRGSIAGE